MKREIKRKIVTWIVATVLLIGLVPIKLDWTSETDYMALWYFTKTYYIANGRHNRVTDIYIFPFNFITGINSSYEKRPKDAKVYIYPWISW